MNGIDLVTAVRRCKYVSWRIQLRGIDLEIAIYKRKICFLRNTIR